MDISAKKTFRKTGDDPVKVARLNNYHLAVKIEQTEKVIAQLMANTIAVASVQIGIYTVPLIRVHYAPACETLAAEARSQLVCKQHQVIHTSVFIGQCLVQWDAPMKPANVH